MTDTGNILVLNCGSSSIKFAAVDVTTSRTPYHGSLESLADDRVQVRLWRDDAREETHTCALTTFEERLHYILNTAKELAPELPLRAIGHRVVHGGEQFREATRITEKILQQLESINPLAPLHNPLNLAGLQAAMAAFPDLPQVAIFDTAFYQGLLPQAWRYALPDAWYRQYGVRRYGFHGISHGFVSGRAADLLGKPLERCNMITVHLGNGASISAIRDGVCVDTSMGMTPLEGLVMGTRCGDIDPEIPLYMQRVAGLSSGQVEEILNRESGLLGLCGSSDMREVLERAALGDNNATLATEIYVHRIRHYIGAFYAETGPLDALVFTGGAGENSPEIRDRVCAGLEHLGITCDTVADRQHLDDHLRIDQPGSATAVLVIHTREELEIARQTAALLAHSPSP